MKGQVAAHGGPDQGHGTGNAYGVEHAHGGRGRGAENFRQPGRQVGPQDMEGPGPFIQRLAKCPIVPAGLLDEE